MHFANRLEPQRGGDWIVEGLAEYYSLKVMWRSGTISDQRYQRAFQKLERRSQEANRLDVDVSRGAVTARAVGILRKLDREIYRKTDRQKSLDDVMQLLVTRRQKVSIQLLRQTVVDVMGESADALSDKQLGIDTSGT
jgi:predicted metalloprotease with PDZ domain